MSIFQFLPTSGKGFFSYLLMIFLSLFSAFEVTEEPEYDISELMPSNVVVEVNEWDKPAMVQARLEGETKGYTISNTYHYDRFSREVVGMQGVPIAVESYGADTVPEELSLVFVYDDTKLDQQIPLGESLKISFASKAFRNWLFTLLLVHMGLMLFLTGIGTTIPDSLMGIRGWQVTVMNSAAFAPVPLMLIIYNAVRKRRGNRFALQTALAAFALAMFTFAAAWKQLWPGKTLISFLIGITASTIGSRAAGSTPLLRM